VPFFGICGRRRNLHFTEHVFLDKAMTGQSNETTRQHAAETRNKHRSVTGFSMLKASQPLAGG
jgi:hypothetical protein